MSVAQRQQQKLSGPSWPGGGLLFRGGFIVYAESAPWAPPQDVMFGGDFEQTFTLQNDAFGKPGLMRKPW